MFSINIDPQRNLFFLVSKCRYISLNDFNTMNHINYTGTINHTSRFPPLRPRRPTCDVKSRYLMSLIQAISLYNFIDIGVTNRKY